jgi:protein tyrosine phosphatase
MRPEGPVNIYELRMTNSDAKGDEKERVIHVIHYPKWVIGKQPDARQILKLIRSTWALENSPGKSFTVVYL